MFCCRSKPYPSAPRMEKCDKCTQTADDSTPMAQSLTLETPTLIHDEITFVNELTTNWNTFPMNRCETGCEVEVEATYDEV